jgi:PAS domain S-box-containing protein
VANVLAEAVQRKQAELAVRATAQELSLIFNKVFDIVIYLSVEGNERYRFLKVNDAFFKATGLSSEQVLGKLITEVIPPGSHSLVLEHYGKAIAQKRTVRWAETSVYPAGNKHGEVSVTPVFDKTGTCTHLVGIVHDVTERREAEMATEKERKQLRDVIDSLSIFVGLFSTDGIVLEVNRAPLEASGLSREEVMGKFFWETPPWSYSPAVQARLRDALARAGRGEVVRYDEVVRMAGDQLRVVDTIFSPLRDANGEIVQIVGSGGDITKRQQMEEDLRGSRGELRSLATNLRTAREQEAKRISREIHDQLGQALTGLQMDVTALRRTVEKNGQAALTRKLDEMAKAIEETLQTARRVAAELRPAILDELGLTAAIEWQTRQFEERSSIFCNLVLPAESPVLEPERATAVFRIFQEVLTNVSRHANATEVSVELRVDPGKLVLQVRDNGVGIEKIELARMRGHGLVGMQERALEAGFDLEVRSAAGEGTTVIIEVSTGGGP